MGLWAIHDIRANESRAFGLWQAGHSEFQLDLDRARSNTLQ
jgi:phage protein U